MLAYLDQKVSRDNQVKFLAVMAGQLDVLVLRVLVISALDVQRLCNPVLESICLIPGDNS